MTDLINVARGDIGSLVQAGDIHGDLIIGAGDGPAAAIQPRGGDEAAAPECPGGADDPWTAQNPSNKEVA